MTAKIDENHVFTPEAALRIAKNLHDRAEGVEGVKLNRETLISAAALIRAYATDSVQRADLMRSMAKMEADRAAAERLVKMVQDGFDLINHALGQMPRRDEAVPQSEDLAAG